MPAQGELFRPLNADGTQAGKPAPPPRASEPEPAPVWLQRMSLIVLVVFCFLIGSLLVILPWGPYLDQNGWLLGHPAIMHILKRGWVRGVFSGIGLLDVWIGVSELLQYRDYRA